MLTSISLYHPSLTTIGTLPTSNVVHASSGLILHYLTNYSPADRIVSFTVSIPMTWDMCYLLPINAIRKIPGCQRPSGKTSARSSYRRKRLILDIISIGIGSATLVLLTHNSIQIMPLQNEIKEMKNSLPMLTTTTNAHTTQLLHLSKGQLQLAHSMNHTQAALNQTITLVNEQSTILGRHTAEIEELAAFAKSINHKFYTFMHSIETHFLHTSISDIIANRLNLHFIHHQDMPTVLEFIITTTNVSFNSESTHLPLVELVSRLLVQQHIHFVPQANQSTTSPSTIGILSITSFFAASTHRQSNFLIYELLPIPFTHSGTRVRLADMPFIIGIDSTKGHLIRWTKSESTTCDFQAMSVCRETPPLLTNWNNTCIFQILTDTILSTCRTEQYPDPIFIHRLGNHCAISTNSTHQCHTISRSHTEKSLAFQNNIRTIPAVALITIPPQTTLICDSFAISSHLTVTGPSLSILDSTVLNTSLTETFDLDRHLSNATHWPKLPFISGDVQAILDFLTNTPTPSPTVSIKIWHDHPFSYLSLTFVLTTIVLLVCLCYCHYIRKTNMPTIPFHLPSSPLTS